MKILDLDLDFFIDKRLTGVSDYGKRADSGAVFPWEPFKVQKFLETQCGLSKDTPTKGRVVEHHHEAFFFWRELTDSQQIELPFEVVHVDAHSDLGLGMNDLSQVFIMSELLYKPPAERMDFDYDELKPGNYLAFVVACRWISKIIFVKHPLWRSDLPWLHFKDYDINSGYLQLKKCLPEEINDLGKKLEEMTILEFEPEVPFEMISESEYKNDDEPFSFIILSQSPGYTPETADQLIPIIKEYIEEI